MTYRDLSPEFYRRKPWRLSLWGRRYEWWEAHRMNESGGWFDHFRTDDPIRNWSA